MPVFVVAYLHACICANGCVLHSSSYLKEIGKFGIEVDQLPTQFGGTFPVRFILHSHLTSDCFVAVVCTARPPSLRCMPATLLDETKGHRSSSAVQINYMHTNADGSSWP